MHPVLFEIGPFTAYSYGLFLALGFGVSLLFLVRDVAVHLAPRVGWESAPARQAVWDLFLVFVIPLSLLGARTFYVLEHVPEFQGRWHETLYVWQGGLVFYGGLLAGVAAALWRLGRLGWPRSLFLDLAAPYILLGHAFGRMGCWLNGCCYGIVDFEHGMVIPALGDGVPRLPTQLYEMGGDLALFAGLLALRRRILPYPWLSLALYGTSYGILRFFLEFLRREEGGPRTLGVFLSPSQLFSVVMVGVSLAAAVWTVRREKGKSQKS